MNPEISVIMSIWNEPKKWLHESIESILAQSFKNFEFIIINDNPSRSFNKELLDEYLKLDDRITVVNNKVSIGLTKSLNIGLAIAKGPFIARMDGDDISRPNRLDAQYKYMKKNDGIGVCGCYLKLFGDVSVRKKKYYIESELIKGSLVFENPIPHSGVFIRKCILTHNIITYNEDYLYSQDYKLWSDLAQITDFTNIPKVLLNYRVHEKQLSQTKDEIQKNMATQIREKEILKYLGKYYEVFKNLESNRIKFRFILKYFDKSIKRSFILLGILLSGEKLSVFEYLRMLLHLPFWIILDYRRIIARKILFPNKH